jgi:hypothetical protein
LSKLFHLKKWLTIPEVAARLSDECSSAVTESDVLQLALDDLLIISVNFVNRVAVRDVQYEDVPDVQCKRFSAFAVVEEIKNRDKDDVSRLRFLVSGNRGDTVVSLGGEVDYITGVYELIMCSDGARDIERKYYEKTGGPSLSISGNDGVYIDGPSHIYQIQESLDDAVVVDGSSAQLKMLKNRILAEKIPKQEAADLLADHEGSRARIDASLSASGRKLRDFLYPALSLPADCVLVVRTEDIKKFEQTHLHKDCPGVFDSMLPTAALLQKGFVSIASAAGLLADRWVDPGAKQADFIKSGLIDDFARAMVDTMNSILRECANGRMQAYAPDSGMPLRVDGTTVFDHTCLVRIDDLDTWRAKNWISFDSEPFFVESPLHSRGEGSSSPNVDETVESNVDAQLPNIPWAITLFENMASIDAQHGGAADISQVMRWLKKHGAPDITSEGERGELVFIDGSGTRQTVKKKTVSNKLKPAREYARS